MAVGTACGLISEEGTGAGQGRHRLNLILLQVTRAQNASNPAL